MRFDQSSARGVRQFAMGAAIASLLAGCATVPATPPALASEAAPSDLRAASAPIAAPPPAPTPAAVTPPQRPWWTHATIYEIYPRSFQDSNGDGVGDLNGITQRLDYLQSLGVDALWITPFFPSPNADFGYDIADYTNVAPEYGTLADWDRLVAEARRRNMRVMVDFVVNHTSAEHPWFRESRSSRTNPKRDWYMWHDPAPDGGPPTHWPSIFTGTTWAYDAATRQYYYHIFLPEQPDLNWANPEVRDAMFDVARFWLRRGASGFRLDATPYLFEDTAYPEDPAPQSGPPPWLKPYNSGLPQGNDVLRQLRDVMEEFPGDPALLGESATANIGDLRRVYGANNDEINLPMNFLFGNIERLDAALFKRRMDEAHSQLDGNPPVFFFSSHDQRRQWSEFGDGVHNDAIAKMSAALLLLQPGTAILYYGEELGMGDAPRALLESAPTTAIRPRRDDRDRSRTPMQWTSAADAGFSTAAPWLPVNPQTQSHNAADEAADAASVLRWYQALLALRRSDPLFRDGTYLPLSSGNASILAFGRQLPDGSGAVIAMNMSAQVQPMQLSGLPDGATLQPHPAIAGAGVVTSTNASLGGYAISITRFARP